MGGQLLGQDVENTVWHDEGVAIDGSFRVEIRESYVHDARLGLPGGAGYAISLSNGSLRGAGRELDHRQGQQGDGGPLGGRRLGLRLQLRRRRLHQHQQPRWIEVGLNASHMVGLTPRAVRGQRRLQLRLGQDPRQRHLPHGVPQPPARGSGKDFGDASRSARASTRCAGATYYSYWHTFIGNVLGVPGQMAGWLYESGDLTTPPLQAGLGRLGALPRGPEVAATTVRHGNYDYLTNSVKLGSGVPRAQRCPARSI